MKNLTLRPWLLLALLVLTANAFAQLKVNGRYLYDQCGEKVVMRGVNEMLVYSSDRTGAVTYPEIAKTGANAVRFMWFTDASVPASALDANVKNAVANGLIPIPGLWDATGKWGADLEKCVAWWTSPAIATVCKNNPYLVVNIANEAGGSAMLDYTSVYANAIGRIRNAGITNVIMVDADRWGRNWQTISDKGAAVLAADPQKNVLFSWHPWDTNMDYATPINTIAAKNLCLVVGEFSYKSVGCSCCINYKQIISAAQTQGVGTLAWSWGLSKNGDCADGSMDMTTNGTFAGLKAGWPTEISTTDPNSIKNTSVRPYSIRNAGKCATTTVDAQAPSAPTGLASSNVTGSSFTLTWTASTDNVGVTGYDVYRGTVLAGSSTTTSFNVTGLSASTAYSMTVRAKDAAGNVSAASTTLMVTTSAAPVAGTNLALNKPTVTSSAESTSLAGAQAVDGSVTTRWASVQGVDPQWLQVDLGASYSISRVVLNWEAAYASGYSIQVSGNGTNWTIIYSTTTGNGALDELTGLSGTGRYIRMYGTTRGTAWGYSLWEFAVYGSASTTPPPAGSFSGTYKITARHSGKALDVNGGSTADGANVQQWTSNGSAAQQWIITATTDGYYRLVSKASGKALEVSNNSLADGGNVQQWAYAGSNSQQWKIEATTDGYYRLLNRNSGKALDVSGVSTADGANVHQWTYGGGLNQQWKIELLSTATARRSFEAAAAETVSLFPNPVKDGVLHVKVLATEAGKAVVALSGAAGGRTLRKDFAVRRGENLLKVNTHGLPSGLYFLSVQHGARKTVKKVVIGN